jgi:hypothetical protein
MLSFGFGIVVGVAVTLCIALLVVLALLRWRRQRLSVMAGGGVTKADHLQQEMEWDNSTFNITVNPLDRESGFDEDAELQFEELHPAAVDDDDDEFAANCSTDEIDVEAAAPTAGGKLPGCKELEWDDSTLSY